ncbi:MAG: hypothetical protein ACJ8GN_02075 [Longimicrobiaceae bacterium]|jgi:hypothetical protein
MQPKRYYQQLKSTAGDVVTLTPAAPTQTVTFRFDNIDAKMGREWCYAEKIRLFIRSQVDQPSSGGSAIQADQLYRILSSIKLSSDDIGVLYGPGDLNGPALGLIAQVVSNKYALPIQPRTAIAAADGDTAFDLVIDIPLAHRCFHKGHQTGIWNGFLKRGGQLDVTGFSSTCYDAVSTGAVIEATTDIRAELVYTSEPEARPPVFWHWRMRATPGSETKHTIRNVCQGAGITGAMGAGKIAFLAYLADVNGLGGADGVDNITRVYPRDRGQPNHNLSTPFFGPASYMADFVEEIRRANIMPVAVGQSYPFGLGTQVEGRGNVATAYFLPYFWPDLEGQQVSKLQEWSGDYYIEHDYTATPSGLAQWLSLELSYLTAQQEEFLMGERMGLPSSVFRAFPKVDRPLHDAGDADGFAQQQAKLRGIPKKIRAVR